MNKIKEIQLSDGSSIFVEMEEADLPEGVKETSGKADAMELLEDTLCVVAETVRDGIREAEPDEWTLELNIGFKGKANPVPVILSGESKAAIKVTAKWFNYDEDEDEDDYGNEDDLPF